MIKEKYLVFGGQELGVIISILGIIISFMMKFGVYEVKTIATIILIVIVLLAVFVYCNFMLFIIEICRFLKNKFKKSKISGSREVETNKVECKKEEDLNLPTKKQKQAIDYIKKTFKDYVEYDRDLENLCNAINDYSNGKTDFSNHVFVKVKKLSNLDLYHFAWSIWNHFRVGKQDVIVKLLKVIFATKLSDVDVKTIKSHLKDDENKGIVKIKEDLSNPDEQKK